MMCIELLENGKSGKVQRNIDLTVISYLTYPLVTKKNVTFETVQFVMETAKENVLSKPNTMSLSADIFSAFK